MNRKIFEDVVKELPELTADGFLNPDSAEFHAQRKDFLQSPRYPEEVARVREFLAQIPKSERFSDWQRENCDPTRLLAYFRWKTGDKVSPGSIIAAAVSLGFTMGVRETHQVYFNFSAPLIESGLAELRSYEQIHKVARA